MVPAQITIDGLEQQFGTNHLGHFALTNLLLAHVTDRVVTLSSSLHRSGSIDLEDLNWQRRPYSATGAYAAGSPVRALAAHPGWAATNLQGRTGSWVADRAATLGNRLFAQSPASTIPPPHPTDAREQLRRRDVYRGARVR
jgi:NAD(P)-dependent dehydrogenase (short-subunit alcohol dehydrogenase family)